MVVTLKLNRAGFALLIAIVTATGTFLAAVLPLYLSRDLVVAVLPFAAAIVSAIVVYLSTEEAALGPAPVPPASPPPP